MTTRRGSALWALLAVVLFGAGTSCAPFRPSWQPPRPVKIEGIGEAICYNFFPSSDPWWSRATEGKPAGVLVRDGDLVEVFGSGNDAVFIYQASDGPVLKPTFEEGRMLLAGKVVSLSLEKREADWEWLEKASTQELAGVRFLWLPEELDAARLPTLKKLAHASPNVGLAVFTKQPFLSQVLPLFKPRVLFLAGVVPGADERKVLADQKQLDTVLWWGNEPGSLDFLAGIPNLRRLAILSYDVEKSGPLPKGLKSLKSLLVSGAKMKDVSWLADAPAGLEEVSLMSYELSDVSGLAKLTGLKTVILNGSVKVLDLSSLASLKKLQWMGLPPNISQEEFTAFVKAHPGLKFLEMVQCKNVTDLSPLRDLKGLEALVLLGPYIDLDMLQGIKSLRFVAISDETFSESPDQVVAVQKALPDALVVPGAWGCCLGSGWILLLFPAVALLWFLRSRRWRRPATGKHYA